MKSEFNLEEVLNLWDVKKPWHHTIYDVLVEAAIEDWEEATRKRWPSNIQNQPIIDSYLLNENTFVVEILE